MYGNEEEGVSSGDELFPDILTFTETNRDLHAAAAICSGSEPKGCESEVVKGGGGGSRNVKVLNDSSERTL
ncbi:Hypothetical protein SMAX5B_007286 [Scophthalmus maximus]|uniref:Uncharacterized protein n=1 Tax=Scophthalmus maximus TaxID=52904 RepID=A0A2U9BQP1_SCOMX|nr:Hypothetical protein SMAX5B_007286 [Scophthalmus maximus]